MVDKSWLALVTSYTRLIPFWCLWTMAYHICFCTTVSSLDLLYVIFRSLLALKAGCQAATCLTGFHVRDLHAGSPRETSVADLPGLVHALLPIQEGLGAGLRPAPVAVRSTPEPQQPCEPREHGELEVRAERGTALTRVLEQQHGRRLE